MRVTADRDACVGGGLCVLTAPEVFDQGDDGVVTVLAPDPPEGLRGRVRDAVRLCPGRALSADR